MTLLGDSVKSMHQEILAFHESIRGEVSFTLLLRDKLYLMLGLDDMLPQKNGLTCVLTEG